MVADRRGSVVSLALVSLNLTVVAPMATSPAAAQEGVSLGGRVQMVRSNNYREGGPADAPGLGMILAHPVTGWMAVELNVGAQVFRYAVKENDCFHYPYSNWCEPGVLAPGLLLTTSLGMSVRPFGPLTVMAGGVYSHAPDRPVPRPSTFNSAVGGTGQVRLRLADWVDLEAGMTRYLRTIGRVKRVVSIGLVGWL